MQEVLGNNIRFLREKLGLTQRQLAEKMFGKAERSSYVSDVESGKAGNIKLKRLAQFATALNCQPSDLLLTNTALIARLAEQEPAA